mmetsp:Transcript_4005/g.9332  ORF Transcript_4005/g.9332 Transcript_4005/m.9332 type:complete len:413 (-) Transcript_4005:80-1318(-)|eukprot:CAMPEP_0170619424 /NCGR_PEP_ID=MMETSP0224-20130122/27508_1 /TAXON_ID=285029 /ORGANISM="Togula jolla, Strain CCCM 725" /LENGTH=412 /DNA_ID=CAMNT_0010945511 /DNA_START=40 /DNA_END=1278 /DNA_ORIENTATION=+
MGPWRGSLSASLVLILAGYAFGAEKKKLGFPLPPDTRPSGCSAQTSDPGGGKFEDLKVSIIIPYRNEKLEHIKGSLASIFHFTPKKYIEELLMVSDGNTPAAVYRDEITSFSKLIRILELPPSGLIKAKMTAVTETSEKSSVIVFLEPHIRVNRMWLEPLLTRIRLNPHVLAMPLLDPIPQDNFDKYLEAGHGHWRFEWNFNLVFSNPEQKTTVTKEPYYSPATSGGIFAIRKDWWNELELYDPGMIGWGGDHIEATMKVWRCGGAIETVPCSRVGHLFRDPDHRPYPVEVPTVVRNYARVAVVWLDEYLPYFYKVKGETEGMDIGDVSAQIAMRERLQCKNMSWYLENVDREMLWEKDHICIPGCNRKQLGNICCEKPQYGGRSTIDRVIPLSEYRPLPSPNAVKLGSDEL